MIGTIQLEKNEQTQIYFRFTKLPDRFIISFEAPVIEKGSSIDFITPDQAISRIQCIPTLPALLSINAGIQPSVGKVILQKQYIQDFSYDRQLASNLKADPNLINCLEAIVHRRESEIDSEQLNKSIQTLTALLNIKSAQSQQVMVNAFYCCDLSILLHSQLQEREQIIQQNMNMQNRDLMRFCNYAPPEYLLPPCDINTDPQFLIQTRKQFLKELHQAKGHILDQYLCRYYTLLETSECGIDFASLVPDQYLIQAKKLAKGKISAFELRNIASGQNLACSKGTDGEFLLQNLKIRDELQNQSIIVFAVTTADNNLETVLQEPCNPEEFMGYKFKQQDSYQQFDVHMRFNFPRQHLLCSLQNNATGAHYQGNANGAIRQAQFKNQRVQPKGGRTNTETEEVIYQRFPWIFPNNFSEYYNFLKSQNICKPTNHSLEMDSQIKLKMQQNLFLPNKKFIQQLWAKKFWQNVQLVTEQINKNKNISINSENLKILWQKFIAGFSETVRSEYDDLGEKPTYQQLFESPALFMIVQGIYSNFLQINSPMNQLIRPFINIKLDVQKLIMSSINLIRGIEQLLQHRIAVDFNASFLSLESISNQQHLISPFYTAWAMTSQFGYGLLEYFKIVKQMKPHLIQQILNEQDKRQNMVGTDDQGIESVFAHVKQVVEYLQTLTQHQIRYVNQEPLSPLNEKTFTQLSDCQLGEINDSHKLPIDRSVAYDFKTVNDYLLGIPCIPSMQQEQLLNCNPLNGNFTAPECTEAQETYTNLICDYQASKYHLEVSSNLYKHLQVEEDDCEDILDDILALAHMPSQGPLRLLQTGDQDLLLAPMTSYGPDLCIVQRVDRLKVQLRNCGYDTQLFDLQESSADQAGVTRGKDNLEAQKQVGNDLLYQCADQLLSRENCVQYVIANTSYKVNVPKIFLTKDVECFWNFVAQLELDRINELGIDKIMITTVADIDRFSRSYRPGLVYDNDLRAFLYMPLVLSADHYIQSQSLHYNIDLSKQSELLQSLLLQEHVYEPGSGSQTTHIQCSVLEMIAREYIPAKLQTPLNNACRQHGTVKQLLANISKQLLSQHDFEGLLAKLLCQESKNQHNISLNFDLPALIAAQEEKFKAYTFPQQKIVSEQLTEDNLIAQIVRNAYDCENNDKQDKKLNEQFDEQLFEFLSGQDRDLKLMQLVLDSFEELDSALSECSCTISVDECDYINSRESILQQINTNKQLLMGNGGVFNNFDIQQTIYNYQQYNQVSQKVSGENGSIQVRDQFYKLSINQFLQSSRQQVNHYDLLMKDVYNSRNFVILARYGGLKIAYQLFTGTLNPDAPEAATQKFFGFESMEATLDAFKALNITLQNLSQVRDKKLILEVFQTNLKRIKAERTDNPVKLENNLNDGFEQENLVDQVKMCGFGAMSECERAYLRQGMSPVTINPDLKALGPLEQFYEAAGTKILGPLFKSFGVAEARGFAPVVDVYGRVLRTASPYSLQVMSSVRDDPIQLETEAPPAPAAAGEEAAAQSLIDFWENVKNRFFQLPDERIRALTAPLFCLEEREIEFLIAPGPVAAEQARQDAENGLKANNQAVFPREQNIGDISAKQATPEPINCSKPEEVSSACECRCNELSAILYPAYGSAQQQLDPQMRGIYYLSPYYIPPINNVVLPRRALFKRFAQKAITEIAHLICQPIQVFSNQNTQKQAQNASQNSVQDPEIQKAAFEAVGALFLAGWSRCYSAEHITALLPEECLSVRGSMPNLIFELQNVRQRAENLLAQEKASNVIQKQNFAEEEDWHVVYRKLLIAETRSTYSANLTDTSAPRVATQLKQFYQLKDVNMKIQQLQYVFAIAVALLPQYDLFAHGDPEDPLRPVPAIDVAQVGEINTQNIQSASQQHLNGPGNAHTPQIQGNPDFLSRRNETDSQNDFSGNLKEDTLLLELVKKQNELYELEQDNLRVNAQLASNLRQLKAQDIRNDLHELFATAVTAAWAKLCAGDKAKDAGRVSHDQLALGGFETNGPRGDYSASAKFNQIAKDYGLDFGHFDWEKDCFDVKDIVDFD